MLLVLHGHDAWEQSFKNSIPNGGERWCRFQLHHGWDPPRNTGGWYKSSLRPRKTNMNGWKIPIFSRKFRIHLHLWLIFQPVMLVSLGCISFPICSNFFQFLGNLPVVLNAKTVANLGDPPSDPWTNKSSGVTHLYASSIEHPESPEYHTFKLIGSILSYQILTSPLKTKHQNNKRIQKIHFSGWFQRSPKFHPP